MTTILDYNGQPPRTLSAVLDGRTIVAVEVEPTLQQDDGQPIPEFDVYVPGVAEVGTVYLHDGEAVLEAPEDPRGPVLQGIDVVPMFDSLL